PPSAATRSSKLRASMTTVFSTRPRERCGGSGVPTNCGGNGLSRSRDPGESRRGGSRRGFSLGCSSGDRAVLDLTFVETVFCGALEKPSGSERAASLAEACGDNAGLRRHVERLLAAHPRAAGFPRTCRCLATREPDSAESLIGEPRQAPAGAG